jgi:hypothetical protein
MADEHGVMGEMDRPCSHQDHFVPERAICVLTNGISLVLLWVDYPSG